MKQRLIGCRAYAGALLMLVGVGSNLFAAQSKAQTAPTKAGVTTRDKAIIKNFTLRANAFVKLRNRIRGRIPKLSKDSTAEQIAAHKHAFEDAVRAARTGAKPGDIITTDTAEYIRRLIRSEFKGTERGEVKKVILEAETGGVPLRVNYPYPDAKEFSEVPAKLLLELPLLPKELNYRFAGRHMLLLDKENGLILDYMLNALP